MDLKNTAEILINGTKEDIKSVLKELEKHSARDKVEKKRVDQFIRNLVDHFTDIRNPTNKIAVLKSLEIFSYARGFSQYNNFKSLIFTALEDENGNVRQGGYYLAEWFMWSLLPDTNFRWSKAPIGEYEEKLLDFVLGLDSLSKKHESKAKGKIYINDLKPCPFKTIQKLINRMYYVDLVRKVMNKYDYEFHPDDKEVFGEDSDLWEKVDNTDLELHEVEFVRKIVKSERSTNTGDICSYIFEVGLTGTKIKRFIKIINTLSLYSLGYAIVFSFDFDFDHSFGFYSDIDIYKSKKFYELFTDLPEIESTPKAGSVKKTKIRDVWKKVGEEMYFLFDYGDNWIFEVKLSKMKHTHSIKYRREWEVIKEIGSSPEQYPNYDENLLE